MGTIFSSHTLPEYASLPYNALLPSCLVQEHFEDVKLRQEKAQNEKAQLQQKLKLDRMQRQRQAGQLSSSQNTASTHLSRLTSAHAAAMRDMQSSADAERTGANARFDACAASSSPQLHGRQVCAVTALRLPCQQDACHCCLATDSAHIPAEYQLRSWHCPRQFCCILCATRCMCLQLCATCCSNARMPHAGRKSSCSSKWQPQNCTSSRFVPHIPPQRQRCAKRGARPRMTWRPLLQSTTRMCQRSTAQSWLRRSCCKT